MESDTQLLISDEENREENMFEFDTFHDSLRAHKKGQKLRGIEFTTCEFVAKSCLPLTIWHAIIEDYPSIGTFPWIPDFGHWVLKLCPIVILRDVFNLDCIIKSDMKQVNSVNLLMFAIMFSVYWCKKNINNIH